MGRGLRPPAWVAIAPPRLLFPWGILFHPTLCYLPPGPRAPSQPSDIHTTVSGLGFSCTQPPCPIQSSPLSPLDSLTRSLYSQIPLERRPLGEGLHPPPWRLSWGLVLRRLNDRVLSRHRSTVPGLWGGM